MKTLYNNLKNEYGKMIYKKRNIIEINACFR